MYAISTQKEALRTLQEGSIASSTFQTSVIVHIRLQSSAKIHKEL